MSAWQPIEDAFRDPRVTGEQRTLFVARFGKEELPSFNCVYFDPVFSNETYPWVFVEGGEACHREWPTHWMFAEDAAPAPTRNKEE